MNTPITLLFFGSTSDSLIVLKKIHEASWNIGAIITQPPRPVGRKQIITPTPTEIWAKEHGISVLSFPTNEQSSILYADENAVINALSSFRADLLVSASYGQKIPTKTIAATTLGGLNIHPSLLPRWRGADPIPWTILAGDNQTGATVVTLTEQMDEGKIIAQKKISITNEDTHILLRERLFDLGVTLFLSLLPDYIDGKIDGQSQTPSQATFARRMTRDDGYIPWNILESALQGIDVPPEVRPVLLRLSDHHISLVVERAIRALAPWPGVWTTLNIKGEDKRVKILSGRSEHHNATHILYIEMVQIEGKNPMKWEQFIQILHT